MDLVIRNVTLIDGTEAQPASRVTVEVAGGAVSRIGEGVVRPGPRVHREDIDGSGLTLMPGMIDCHEHFTGDGGLDSMERLLGDTEECLYLEGGGQLPASAHVGRHLGP